MTNPDSLKQLRIKTGCVKRTAKELQCYREEEAKQQIVVDKMVEEKKYEYDIKQQREVLNDTRTVIPDTVARLEKMLDDLNVMLESDEVLAVNGNTDDGDEFTKQVLTARSQYEHGGKVLTELGGVIRNVAADSCYSQERTRVGDDEDEEF